MLHTYWLLFNIFVYWNLSKSAREKNKFYNKLLFILERAIVVLWFLFDPLEVWQLPEVCSLKANQRWTVTSLSYQPLLQREAEQTCHSTLLADFRTAENTTGRVSLFKGLKWQTRDNPSVPKKVGLTSHFSWGSEVNRTQISVLSKCILYSDCNANHGPTVNSMRKTSQCNKSH